MDAKQLLAVLDPVSQEAGASPLRIRGMGVGLAVVRAVVARHGGWLHAVSTLGELVHTLAREQLGSPAVIVVGDVVSGIAAAQGQAPQLRAA